MLFDADNIDKARELNDARKIASLFEFDQHPERYEEDIKERKVAKRNDGTYIDEPSMEEFNQGAPMDRTEYFKWKAER